jgi:hypothetical protein
MTRVNALSETLLIDRRRAAEMLGVSVMTIIRLEQTGSLPRVRINKFARHPKALYRLGDVIALASDIDTVESAVARPHPAHLRRWVEGHAALKPKPSSK